jgi:hypothetical protein
MQITGTFTATGGEKYLTIGNFKNDATTNKIKVNNSADSCCSYYYIDDVSVYSDSVTGINELKRDNEFNLFPNPNNGSMQLNYKIKPDSKGSLVIYDITGKLIVKYALESASNQLQINSGQLNNGIYLYHILVNDHAIKSDKLVIIK